jgi:hypothetical protein
VARTTVMRATIHLVTADDVLGLRPLMQPVLEREIRAHPEHAPRLAGVELGPVLDAGRKALAGRGLSGKELRAVLGERFPELDPAAMAYACRCLLTLVQVPPRAVWGHGGQVRVATAESWLGRSPEPTPSIDEVVLRYLAAFGPATTGDVATWCRLTGLAEMIDRLRPQLRPFRDERGRKLVDLPDAPRPDPDMPAPTRFLPVYDNVLLSHDDRSRFGDKAEVSPLYAAPPRDWCSVLHDGRIRATWRIDRAKSSGDATLVIRHRGSLPRLVRDDLTAEGERLLQFAAPEAPSHDIHFTAVA